MYIFIIVCESKFGICNDFYKVMVTSFFVYLCRLSNQSFACAPIIICETNARLQVHENKCYLFLFILLLDLTAPLNLVLILVTCLLK